MLFAGCIDSAPEIVGDSLEQGLSIRADGDQPSAPAVLIRWNGDMTGKAALQRAPLKVIFENTRTEPVSAQIFIFGMGLDARVAGASLGDVQLAARGVQEMSIALSDLPVQATGSAAQIQLRAVSSGSTWTNSWTHSAPLYVRYAPDYAAAYVSANSPLDANVAALVGAGRADAKELEAVAQTSNNLHCLQSWEQESAAISEGFAHFVAARIFNDTSAAKCSFVYYKEFLDRLDFGFVYPPMRKDLLDAAALDGDLLHGE